MGVKGLTTYIAKRAEQYLAPFELRDTCLVIDGDSLASNLYQWHPFTNAAFGGDYNQYHHIVIKFFAALHKCGVRSFVLLDGGYQRRKLKTVYSRLRSKIGSIRHVNPLGGNHLFPLHMRECFVNAIRGCAGVQLMRCLFEADDEVAQLARQLNCPVLSYDSDFYIHNVLYIPFVTLTRRPIRCRAPRRNRRKPAATNAAAQQAFREYWYIDCSVYTIGQLTRGQIRRDVWPLFGVLLGNDYIGRRVFAKFFAGVSTRHVGRRHTPQQKRIVGLLRWLRDETLTTAMAKVLGSVSAAERGQLKRDIDRAMEGYVRASSEAFEYFGLTESSVRVGEWDVNDVEEQMDDEDEDEEDEEEEEEDEEEEDEEQCEDDAVDVKTQDEDDQAISESDGSDSDENNSDPDVNPHTPADFQHRQTIEDLKNAPAWLLKLIRSASLPRYVVDMLALRLYINAPQMENVELAESNSVARPLLGWIYTIVHHPEMPTQQLRYLTRDPKNRSQFIEQKLDAIDLSGVGDVFRPEQCVNKHLLDRALFGRHLDLVPYECLPKEEQLFGLSLAYLDANSKIVRMEHLHALLLTMFALRRCAERGCTYADEEHFLAQYGGYVAVHAADPTRRHADTKKHEAIMLARNLCAYMKPISKTVRSRHTAFSASVVHAFAEWQAVALHINTLNVLLAEPYPSMRIAELFNGTLAYHLTVMMANRMDMPYYISQFLFRGCPSFAEEYAQTAQKMAALVIGLYSDPCIRSDLPSAEASQQRKPRKSTRNQRKLAKKRDLAAKEPQQLQQPQSLQRDNVEETTTEANNEENDADEDYNGIGNRFANLLL